MAKASTTASAAAFAVVLMAMWAGVCVLVGFGFALAFGEIPESPSAAAVPAWCKFVAFGLAVLVALASFPVAAKAARAVQRSVARQPT